MKINTSNQIGPLLSGGGEMGDLIRKKDWSKTPIGNPETWSQSLKTTLSIMLNSKFPMFLFWGPELICFYNDAYRPSLGNDGKHPSILGSRGEIFWQEIWTDIKPIIDLILAGGEANWSEDQLLPIYRNNQIEDVYWTFSYSLIYDETGNTEGIFVTCVETTKKVKALQNLKESQEKLQFAIDATQLGTWDLNPKTNVFTFNEQLKQWFGIAEPSMEMDVTSVLSIIVEEDRQKTTDAIAAAIAKGSDGIYEIQHRVLSPLDGKERNILAKGKAFFDEDSVVYRFSGTGQDITDEVLYKKMQEDRYNFNTMLLESNPDCVKIIDNSGRITYMNENGVCILEGESKAFFINREWKTLWDEKESIRINDAIERAFKGETINFQAPALTAKGTLKWWDVIVSALPDENGVIKDLLAVSRDISGLKSAEKKLEESEEQLRFAMEGGNLGFFDTYPQKGELNWSAKTKEFYGLAPEAEVNWEVYQKLIHPDDFEKVQKIMTENLQNVKSDLYENEYRTSSENCRWLRIIGKIKFDENGKAHRVTGVVQDITDKKLAEIKINDSEKNFRMLADKAPMWIWLMDKEVNIQYANPELLRFVGVDNYLAFTGKVWETVIHTDDISTVYKHYSEGASLQQSFSFECRMKNVATEAFEWILISVVTRYDEANEFIGFIGTGINIHQRKTQLSALEESEERFRTLAETLPQLIWITDEKGNYEFVTRKWQEYLGFHPTTSEDWETIVHPDDFVGINQAWASCLSTGEVYKYDVRLKSKNGEYSWFTVHGEPVFDITNKIIKWVGAFTDIDSEKTFSQQLESQVEQRTSELKVLNDVLFQRNDLLSRSESFNRNLTEISPNVVYIHDIKRNRTIFLNQTGLKLIGKSWEDVIESRDKIQTMIIHPDDLPDVLETIEKVKKSKKEEVFEHEYRVKNFEGNWTPILARDIAFKRNDKQQVTQVLGIAIDITEIKKSKNVLEQKNVELEKMNKELESFAYVSSHDLQEPLRKIQAFSSRLMEKETDNLSDTGKDYLRRMRLAGERMQQLIQDLLAYSRTKTSERKFVKTALRTIFADVIEDLKDELNQKNGSVEIGNVCDLNIIPFQFRQLIYNLLSNSLKFAKSNVPPLIKIRCETINGDSLDNPKILPNLLYCHISISDNGIGFDASYKDKIFEIFQRLHGREEYIGTGIGLAIVKKIVENHNGIITANGEPNEGATFDIYIPVE